MAVLVYRPEGVPEERWRRWRIDPDTMSSTVLERIEDATDWTAAEWSDKFGAGSVKAVHALLWSLMVESDPGLTYGSVVFNMSEIEMEAEPSDDKPAPKAKAAKKPRSGNPSVS